MIRLVSMLRRRASLLLAEFSHLWRKQYAPAVASQQAALGLLRCTLTRNIDDPLADAMRAARGGMQPPYDGVAEYWWESEQELRASLRTPVGRAAMATLIREEKCHIDSAKSTLWFAHEYPQIEPTPETAVARDFSGIVKAHYLLVAAPALGTAEARSYWLTQHGPLIRRINPAIGLLRYQQVHRFETDLTVLFQQARGMEDTAHMGHAEAWIDMGAMRGGAEAEAANLVAMEDESIFIDFDRSSSWLGKEEIVVDLL